MLALEGRQLGNYDVIRRIRIGGMGAVYEGRQRTAFDRRVAIKVILGNYASDRDMRRRFMREARVVARLHHPHILPLIEFGDEQGILYLVMPFIDGGTLTSYLRHDLPDLNEVAGIFSQLLDAVEYAHDEGLIHRDIKSSNVLLEMRRSGPPYVYLADFGLVRSSQMQSSQAGVPIPLDQVPGTPHYMAPEQTMGIVTPLTDIYALGVLLYQMLIGELPYDDEDEVAVIQMHLHAAIPSVCERDSSIPCELDDVIRVAMAKRPEDRFQNIAEFREAFLSAMQGPGQISPTISRELPTHNDPVYIKGARPVTVPLYPTGPLARPPFVDPTALASQTPPITHAPASAASPLATQRLRDTISHPSRTPFQPKRTDVRGAKRLISFVGLMVGVIALLSSLVFVPRALGISLFPAGFPLLGSANTATITVTTRTRNLDQSFLLTASPSVKKNDVQGRVIPDRELTAQVNDTRTVPASGKKVIPGGKASGTLLLLNASNKPIAVPQGTTFSNGGGFQYLTEQSIEVPAKEKDPGAANVPIVATSSGAGGNLNVGELKIALNGLLASNQTALAGGSDDQTISIVNQADIDGVKGTLQEDLKKKASGQIKKGLSGREVLSDQIAYDIEATPDHQDGDQANEVQVRVKVTARAVAYDKDNATQLAIALLNAKANQELGNAYGALQGTNPVASQPQVVQRGGKNQLYLNVSVHGTWSYRLTQEQVTQWRQDLKGTQLKVAESYLKSQPGVAGVQIRLPFGSDHLPGATESIEIFLAPTAQT